MEVSGELDGVDARGGRGKGRCMGGLLVGVLEVGRVGGVL